MTWVRFGRTALVTAFTLVASAGLVVAGQPGSAAQDSGGHSGAGDCIAHHPNTSAEYPIWYAGGCTGHDEPELDPVSSLAGSAQDLTWTVVLPSDGGRTPVLPFQPGGGRREKPLSVQGAAT
jgi:hypothetical protein